MTTIRARYSMHVLKRTTMCFIVGSAICWSQLATAQFVAPSTPPTTAPTAASQISGAQPDPDSTPAATVVDPTLHLLAEVCSRELPTGSIFGPLRQSCAESVGVSLRFEAAPGRARLDELVELGVCLERDGTGRPVHLGAVFLAHVPFELLATLGGQPDLRRVEALWQPGRLSPLEVTGDLVGASAARRRSPGADGAGTTVALIDTGIDVLHPSLFHADGGYFAWFDLNQNVSFDPGVDAVDLDRDGLPGHNETLRVLDATTVVDFSGESFENTDGVLQLERDWLYADMNGDRQRNVGVEAGFNEETPTYGEAIFVVDDANNDGVLGVNERLVRLGTSKIRKYVTDEQTFVRGENLIAAGQSGADAAFHGTATAGIVVGGQPPHHQRVGLAPQAELIVFGLGQTLMETTDLPLAYLAEAVDDGADVVLHEWTNAFTQPLDGSTNFEAAMQAARNEGVVQINPVGNLNRSEKHVERQASPGDTVRLEFEVPDGIDGDNATLVVQSVFGSLQWRGAHALDIALEAPDGERVDGLEQAAAMQQSARIDLSREVTSRQTTVVRFYLEATEASTPLAPGRWALELAGFEHDDTVYGRISDAYSNWQPGVGWVEPTRDHMTVAFPATADAAIGVGAYAARHATSEAEPGELRGFSARGPRIDGQPVVDLAAPDDPFVPLGASPRVLDVGWGRSWFTPFAGTSGAAPHVAAAAALLRQQQPGARPEHIEQRLQERAAPVGVDALPDPGWGFGKLDVWAALYGGSPPQNSPPEADIRIDRRHTGAVLDATRSSDPDGDSLEFRYDLDYDGLWDTPWIDEARLEIGIPADRHRPAARVAVRDPHGATDGAALSLAHIVDQADAGQNSGDAGPPPGQPQPPEAGCAVAGEGDRGRPGGGRGLWIVLGGLFAGRRLRGR